MSRFDHARSWSVSVFAVAALAVFLTTPASATIQNDAIGFTPNHIFEGGFQGENIDIMNGNMNLRLPIGPRYTLNDWFGYQLELYYNSKIWIAEKTVGSPPSNPTFFSYRRDPGVYGAGFSMGFGRIYRHLEDRYNSATGWGIYRYQTPDGAEHFFCWDPDPFSAGDVCNLVDEEIPAPSETATNTTVDESLKVVKESGPNCSASSCWVVYPGDGTKIWFNHNNGTYDPENGSPQGGYYATRIETIAQNGSGPQAYVNISYLMGGRINEIIDSAGRRTTFDYGVSLEVTITLPAFGGSEQPVVSSNAEAEYVMKFGDESVLNPQGQTRTVQGLRELWLPELDGVAGEKHVFDYDYDDPSISAFGYITGWTVPTGARTEYYYHHYESSPANTPYHSELGAKKLVLDPTDPNAEEHWWIYTRFGNNVARSVEDAYAQYAGTQAAATNPHKVRVLDPLNNLTVYWFQHRDLEGDGECDSEGCRNYWFEGLLWRVDTYVGPNEDASKLVRQELTDYVYDGLYLFPEWDSGSYLQYKSAGLPQRNRVPLHVRPSEQTVITVGSGSEPPTTKRTVHSDWTHHPEGQIGNPSGISRARLVEEYNGALLYRSTYTNWTSVPNFHNRHGSVETRDATGAVVERVEKLWINQNRLDCLRRSASGTFFSWNCGNPALTDGSMAEDYSYDPVTGSMSLKTVQGGDSIGSFETHYTHNLGILETKSYGGLVWDAVDRDIDGNTGLVIESRDAAGHGTAYSWDRLGRLTEIAPASPETPVVITYEDIHTARVKQQTSAVDFTESIYRYDALGRLIREERRNRSAGYDFRESEYDIAGRLTRQSEWAAPGTSAAQLAWTVYDYRTFAGEPPTGVCQDEGAAGQGTLGACQVDTDCPPGECGAPATGPCWYDSHCTPPYNNICGLGTKPDPEFCVLPPSDESLADPLGRIAKVVRPDGGTTLTSYAGLTTRVTVHGIEGISGPLDAATTYTNDAFGRLVAVDSPIGVDASYVYDGRDNLTEVRLSDPATPSEGPQLRRFSYDPLGRLRSATNPENGTVEYLAYGARGELLEYQDAAGSHFKNVYDEAGRLVSKSRLIDGGDPQLLVRNTYDQNGDSGKLTTQESYKLSGGQSALVSTREYAYSPQQPCATEPNTSSGLNGRLKRVRVKIEPWSTFLTTDYCHNVLGLPSELLYPDDNNPATSRTGLKFSYANGVFWRIDDVLRGPNYLQYVVYDPRGAPKEIVRGNDVSLVIDRDAQGRPLDFKLYTGSAFPQWQTGTHLYDLAGNVKQIGSRGYRYDELQRLTYGDAAGTQGLGAWEYYSYDAFGNMLSKQRQGPTGGYGISFDTRTFAVDRGTNRLVTQTHEIGGSLLESSVTPYTYQYDSNGNLVADGYRGYVFDEQNRLSAVWDQADGAPMGQYDYDAAGYRVRAVADGRESYFFRDESGQLLSEFQKPAGEASPPVWNRDYIYALGQAVTMLKNETPRAPARFWATGVSVANLTLNWEAVEEGDLQQYILNRWRRSTPGGAWVQDTGTWINRSVPATETTYWNAYFGTTLAVKYTLQAADSAANWSAPVTLVVHPGDAIAPGAPTELEGSEHDRAVALSWDANAEEDLWGYRVERTDDPNALAPVWETLNEIPLENPEYWDFGLTNGEAYGYRVGAVDTGGHASPPSAVVVVTPWDWVPPARPAGVKAQPGLLAGQIRILWQPVLDADADLAGYIVRRTDDDLDLPDHGTTTSRLDSVGDGVSRSYAVRAVDTSGNASEESVVVTAVARHSGVTIPISLDAEFEVEDQGTTTGSLCNTTPEDDDVLGVRLTWHWTPGTQVTFRIYRAVGTGLDYTQIYEVTASDWGSGKICDPGRNPKCSYFDGVVTGYDHTYYVVAYANVTGLGNRESPASTAATATTEFEAGDATVRAIAVIDDRANYDTDNSWSRSAQIYWSRAMVPELQGYHVYRRCQWQSSSEGPWRLSNRTPNCIHSWVRLTPVPVTQNRFTDTTLGGLGGSYQYAVRPVGPSGVEGELSTIVAADLQNHSGADASHCDEALSDKDIDTKEFTTVTEVVRINGIARLNEPSGDEPDAPTGLTSGWALQEHHIDMDEGIRDSTYGWIKWQRNEESDLAGYHVERAGSTQGPWRRVTTDPIAWWETRYDLKGMWIDRQTLGGWGYLGPDCVVLRVVAVDWDGLESEPSAPQQIPAGCSRAVPTVEAPAVLLASTDSPYGGIEGLCETRLYWPRVAGADKYYVYRFQMKNRSLYFYRTHTQLDSACGEHCEYVESGDCEGPNPNPELDCPWNYTSPGFCQSIEDLDVPFCVNASLQAFYVTAAKNEDASGFEAESPASEIVFWDCQKNPGYARLEAGEATPRIEAVAAVFTENPMAEEQVCSVEATSFTAPSERGSAMWGQDRPSALGPSLAPLLTLGQAAGNPPYGIYDLHVDHLGSTRLVTNSVGEVVSWNEFYPFGEKTTAFHDYNTKLFTGHERDEETGLDYMLARYYGANLGRFLSVDPIAGAPRDPQSWNKYPYVRNNPIRLVDPRGLSWVDGAEPPDIWGGGASGPRPCLVCHDFEGGTKEEREKAYEEQEELRQSLTPETKAYFMDNFGVDIDKELRPGEGTTVNLDWEDENGGKYSRTGNPWDNDINIGAEPGSDQFRELLLHESGHWASDMASWFGSVEPELDDATRGNIDRIIGRYPAIQFRMAFEGYAGYGAEWSQFGSLPTLIP